jgi:hypothetical protein
MNQAHPSVLHAGWPGSRPWPPSSVGEIYGGPSCGFFRNRDYNAFYKIYLWFFFIHCFFFNWILFLPIYHRGGKYYLQPRSWLVRTYHELTFGPITLAFVNLYHHGGEYLPPRCYHLMTASQEIPLSLSRNCHWLTVSAPGLCPVTHCAPSSPTHMRAPAAFARRNKGCYLDPNAIAIAAVGGGDAPRPSGKRVFLWSACHPNRLKACPLIVL